MDVRRIEVGEGERLRALRVAALRDAPGAVAATAEADAARPAEHWDMLGGGPGTVFVVPSSVVVALACAQRLWIPAIGW